MLAPAPAKGLTGWYEVVATTGGVVTAVTVCGVFVVDTVVVAGAVVCTGAEIRLEETVAVGDVTVVTATNSNLLGAWAAPALTPDGGDTV